MKSLQSLKILATLLTFANTSATAQINSPPLVTPVPRPTVQPTTDKTQLNMTSPSQILAPAPTATVPNAAKDSSTKNSNTPLPVKPPVITKPSKPVPHLPWQVNPPIRFSGGGLIGTDHTIDLITGTAISPTVNRIAFELEAFMPYSSSIPALNWLGVSASSETWLPISINVQRQNNEKIGSAKINERTLGACAVFAPLFGKDVRQQIKTKLCPTVLRRQSIDFDETSQGQSQILYTSQSSVATLGYSIMLFQPLIFSTALNSTLQDRSSVSEEANGSTSDQSANWRRNDLQLGVKVLLEGKLPSGWLNFDAELFVKTRQETAAIEKRDETQNYLTSLYGFTLALSYVP